MQVINLSRGVIVARQLRIATTFWQRLKGLIGTPSLPEGSALLIQPCSSIHTCFMQYPIDVVFLDSDDRIIRVLHSIPPYRFGPLVTNAKKAFELPAGQCQFTETRVGDLIKFIEVTANEKN